MAKPDPNTFTIPILWGHCEPLPDDGEEMALEKAGVGDENAPDPKWLLKGIVSSEVVDRDGHVLEQDAIDWTPFDLNGVVHEGHPYNPMKVVGFKHVRRPAMLKRKDNGEMIKANYLEVALDPNRELAKAIRDNHRSLCKAGGLGYGFSVEGDILQMRGNRITKAVVRSVAVDLQPRNQIAYAQPLAAGSIESSGEAVLKAIAMFKDPEIRERVDLVKALPLSSLILARFRERVGDLDLPVDQVRDALAKHGVQL